MRSLLVAPLILLSLPGLASATWSASAGGTATAAAGTMTNATGFAAACSNRSATSSIQLSWTISPDPYVSGYTVVRTDSTGATATILVPDRTTQSWTDSGMHSPGVTFTYTIRATSATTSWRTDPVTATGRPSYTANRGGCVTL